MVEKSSSEDSEKKEEEKSEEEEKDNSEEENSDEDLEEIIEDSEEEISSEEFGNFVSGSESNSGGNNFNVERAKVSLESQGLSENRPRFFGLEGNVGGSVSDGDDRESGENAFSYISRKNREKGGGFYHGSSDNLKVKTHEIGEVAKSWTKPFEDKMEFREIYSEGRSKDAFNSGVYIKSKDIKEIEKERKENKFDLENAKGIYYAHDH